jgi:ATP-binding cassette subfamily B protein
MFHYAVFFPTVELISAVGLALILWYGGLGILKGAVTFGVVVAFIGTWIASTSRCGT